MVEESVVQTSRVYSHRSFRRPSHRGGGVYGGGCARNLQRGESLSFGFSPLETHSFRELERALVKLVTAGPEERVVGVHVVSKDAAEIIQGFAVALRMGATKSDFDLTIGVHPTLAEELVTLR